MGMHSLEPGWDAASQCIQATAGAYKRLQVLVALLFVEQLLGAIKAVSWQVNSFLFCCT